MQKTKSCVLISFLLLSICSIGCQFSANRQNIEGRKLFEMGQYTQAVNKFQSAIKNQPRNPDAYYNLGAVFHSMATRTNNRQSLAQAESFYKQSLDLDPNHVDAHRGLAVLFAQSERKQLAFDSLRSWLSQSPGSPEPRIELARLYREYGDLNTATQLLSDALNVDHRNARALRAMGDIREQSGDIQQAIANYQRSYTLNNLQSDLPNRISALQQRLASAYSINQKFNGNR